MNFINEVKIINNKLIIYFININYDEYNNNLNYDIENYYYINFYNYLDNEIIYHEDLFYKTKEFNWYPIFEIINNNLEESEKICFNV